MEEVEQELEPEQDQETCSPFTTRQAESETDRQPQCGKSAQTHGWKSPGLA